MKYGVRTFCGAEGVTLPPAKRLPTITPGVKTRSFGEYGNPIPLGKGYGCSIAASVAKAYSLGKGWDYNPSFGDPLIDSEVYRFYLALLAYYESKNPIIPWPMILDLIKEEEKGITYLKKVRFYAMLKSMGAFPDQEDPDDRFYVSEADRLPTINDLGDFFNVRYWLFFDQPDPHDEKHFFTPLGGGKKSTYEEFRFVVRNLIPDSLDGYVEEEEILLECSGSSSRTWSGEKTKPNWLNKERENWFTALPLVGYGSYIQKCPGDTRFSTTLSVPHSNSVKLIERQMAEVASDMPFSCYVKDDSEYFKRFSRLSRKHTHFYCRDMKKCGLTQNRRLIQIICEEFKQKHPLAPASKYFGIYDDYSFVYEGVTHRPPRGVGLGMAAALTTIMLVAIFRMTKDRLHLEYAVGDSDALVYHDDFAIGCTDEDTLEDIKGIDKDLLSELDCIPNLHKSFTGESFVLCENYSDEFLGTKESYQRTILKTIHASVNVTHAKYQFQNLYRLVEPSLWEAYAIELADHFGSEFYPNEILSPFELGGWIPSQFCGLDVSLWYTDPTKQQQAAGLSNRLHPVPYKGKRYGSKPYVPPIKRIHPLVTSFGDCEEVFLVNMNKDEVASRFMRMDKPGLRSSYWEEQRKKRIEEYRGWLPYCPMMLDRYYPLYVKRRPRTDCIPPKSMWKLIDVDSYPEVNVFYQPRNPRLQYLKHLNPDALSDKILPWGVQPDAPRKSNRMLTALERERAKILTNLFPGFTHAWGELQIAIPTKRAIFSKEWFDPLSVISFVLSTGGLEQLIVTGIEKPGLNKYMDEGFYYTINREPYTIGINTLVSRLGAKKLLTLNLTYFFEELATILQKKKRAKLLEVYNQVLKDQSDFNYETGIFPDEEEVLMHSDASEVSDTLNDEDFFMWRTTKRNYKNWRNWYFSLIDEALLAQEIARTTVMNKSDWETSKKDDMKLVDPVCRHLWIASGGTFDKDDLPVIDNHILWASDRSGHDSGDVFNDPGSGTSGSDVGLMAGW